MMSFTHLQVRSGYSLMDSTITIEKLLKKAVELRFNAIALTDEHVLYGAVSFYRACQQVGIKPIIGMRVHAVTPEKEKQTCILLAKNNHGYRNLLQLSTYIRTANKESVEQTELSRFTEGLLCILVVTGSGLGSLLEQDSYDLAEVYVQTWQRMFTDGDLYLGVQDHGLAQERQIHQPVKVLQQRAVLPVTVLQDVRYLDEKDVMAYDCLQVMKRGMQWPMQITDNEVRQRHLRSTEEMEQLFGAFWPEALEETNHIKDKCNISFDFDQKMLPVYDIPGNKETHNFLADMCRENLKERYETITDEIVDRLEYELAVIKSMQFSDYFLIVWDFISYAKANNILVGPGRGSAAGSLVAYVLGITDVDPIKYGLLFERFLNPERVSMPDIDIDFSDHRRDEVIAYVRNKYGSEHVAQIITFGTYGPRSIVRDLIKTLGVHDQDARFIMQYIPVQARKTIIDYVNEAEELKRYIKQSEKLKVLFAIASKLEGLPQHVSTHAAGVVISEEPLVEHVPLTSGTNGMNITQFPMNDLEAIGLLKMDFLGLRNLTLLDKIMKTIKYRTNKHITLKTIPKNDIKTMRLLRSGKTNGIFQLESSGMKQVLTNLKPTNFEDIVAVNALYRPGPMEYISVYINRKNNREKITYPHPDLEPILRKTYGVLVYQEQIMQISHQIAGFTLGEADILRRAVSKKKPDVMEEIKEKFIRGCMQNGYEQTVAKQIFSWIVQFSNYGFNRSHAVAYSLIAYQLAYLKAHYPASFFSELLSSVANQQEKVELYIKEAKDMQLYLAGPSINQSYGRFSVEGTTIRMGFLAIKGIGIQVVREIIRARGEKPFKDLFDFCWRVSLKIINRQVLELLITAGTFDALYKNRASLLASIDPAIEQGVLFREFTNESSLFQETIELEASYVEMEDFSQMRKLAYEKELLGIYVSSHPLESYRERLRAHGKVTMANAKNLQGKRNVKSAVVVESLKTIRTKRGDPMAFLTMGDETGEIEAVIFPELYRKTSRWLDEEMLIFVRGKIERRNNRIQWLLADVSKFDTEELQLEVNSRLFIKLTEKRTEEALNWLRHTAANHPGNIPVIIYHQASKQTYQLASEYFIKPDRECMQLLKGYFGSSCVVLEK